MARRPLIPAHLIGYAMRALREEAGLTQQEAADRAGTLAHLVCRLETGERNNPTWKRLCRLLEVYGATLADLERQLLVSRNGKR